MIKPVRAEIKKRQKTTSPAIEGIKLLNNGVVRMVLR